MTGTAVAGAARPQPAPLMFSTSFGLLMVLSAAGPGGIPARIAAALALVAVAVGVVYRPSAALAVIATAAALALSETSVLFTAACGLSATAYLLIRFSVPAPAGIGVATMTGPTAIGMVGFTMAAVAAAIVPWRPAWVPLLAPVLVLGIVVLIVVVCSPGGESNRPD